MADSVSKNSCRVVLHVGFAHSGTKSLQQNFFSSKPGINYVGIPYDMWGGIFTQIKMLEEFQFNKTEVQALIDQQMGTAIQSGLTVVSDESLVNTTEVFATPAHVSRDLIADRLAHFFPGARIVFTIREQRAAVKSMYANLWRNSLVFDGVRLPTFARWLRSSSQHLRNPFICNLAYADIIEVYEKKFGRENILVLPLELNHHESPKKYLERLARFVGVDIDDDNVARLAAIRNRRVSRLQYALVRFLPPRAACWLLSLHRFRRIPGSLRSLLEGGTKFDPELPSDLEEQLRAMTAPGNRRLAESYDLPLRELGYWT